MTGPVAAPRAPARPTPHLAALLAAVLAAMLGVAPLGAIDSPWSDLALARASVAAVRGRVVSTSAAVDPATGAIYTHVTIAVARSWGFVSAPAQVDVQVLGGVAGTTALVVGGQARFAPGEEVLTLLELRPRDHTLAVTGLERGKWSLSPDRDGRLTHATRIDHLSAPGDRPRDAVDDIEALASLAGTRVRLPADWTPTRLPLAAAVAADPGVDVDVPEAGRWHEADWGTPVLVDSAAGGHALFPGGGFAQALRALGAWSAAGALQLAPGTVRAPRCFANTEPSDGRISIAYDDPCDEIPDTSPTLAIGGAYFDLQARRTVQGVSYGRITKGMVVLDGTPSKFAGLSTGCYEEILTHELGHAIGLAHTSAQPAVMAPWLSPACVERAESQPLQSADRAELTARYPMASIDGPPGTPGALTATAQDGTVRVSWSPSTGAPATAFQLIASSVPGGSDRGVAVVQSPQLTVTDVPRGVYYLRVVAVNGLGASGPSAEVTLVVGDGLPRVPVGLMASAGPAGSVRVLWQAPLGGPHADSYTLLVGATPGAPTVQVPVATTSFVTTGVAAGTYYVRAVGVNAAGAGPATPEITVVVP